jgi:hypothetical protein
VFVPVDQLSMQLRVVSCCEKRKNEADFATQISSTLEKLAGGRAGGRARSIAEPEVSLWEQRVLSVSSVWRRCFPVALDGQYTH